MTKEDIAALYSSLAAAFKESTAITMATALDITDKRLKEASDQKARLEIEKEFLRIKLAEQMAKEGMGKTISLENGARFRVQTELFISAPKEVKGSVIQVLKDTGNGSIVSEDFNAMTFASLVKNLTPDEDGMPNPVLVALVEAGMKTTAKDMARRY